MSFTDLFIRRPVLAVVVSLLIFLIGLRALLELPVREFPRLDPASITVTTGYPGAAPDLMQGFVTTPLEQAIATAEGIDYMIGSSSQGTSQITIYVRLNYDPNKALAEIMSKVQQVKNQIPREANDPVIQKQSTRNGVMFIAFSSPTMTRPQIADYLTRVVQPAFSTIDGVASSDIQGGATFAMRLWLDPQRMAARGITGQDVQKAILANNVQSAPGQAKGYFTISNITTDTGLTDAEQFRNLVVKTEGDRAVRLRDVGTVELDARNGSSMVFSSGQEAVVVNVNGTPGSNPIAISRDVHKKMINLQHDLPPSLKMATILDYSESINVSIHDIVVTLVEAVIVVILVIFLALGTFRSVIIPIVTIPLAIVGACSLMMAAGFSINLLTLLAMVLAIGLVVDDAIVVVENVYRHIREGHTPLQAAIIGAREILGAVVAMTITLTAVYAPIGLLGGVNGVLFREFAFTLAGAVLISGTIAVTLAPMMASRMLKADMMEGRFPQFIEHTYDRLAGFYGRRLAASLDYRSATLLFAAVVLGSLYFLYAGSKKELAPVEDRGFIQISTKAPQSANLDYVIAFNKKIEEILRTIPEMAARMNYNGAGSGNFLAGMKPWGERKRGPIEIQPILQQQLTRISGERIGVNLPSPLPTSSGGPPVQMVIFSVEGYERVYRAMDDIKKAAQASGLFQFIDSDLDYNTPEIHLQIDHAKANALGITMQSIGATLAALVGENYVNRFSLNGRSYEVIPQVPRESRLNAYDLTQYYVTTSSGQQIPLSAIAVYKTATGPNTLVEYNQLNSATFSGTPKPGISVGQAIDFMEQTAKTLPVGFGHDYLSDSRQYVTEGNSLVLTFAFALIVIYLVLAAKFESLRDPLVILVSVPMSICGALIPLYFGIATVNIYSQIGLVTLIGLISKHGILMVTFANDMQRNGKLNRRQAIQHAAQVRLRPILMTTAAMVLGVAPLLFATGPGAASRFSIGLVITSGMTVGTLFTLFVLPAVYTLVAQDHRAGATSARAREIAAVS